MSLELVPITIRSSLSTVTHPGCVSGSHARLSSAMVPRCSKRVVRAGSARRVRGGRCLGIRSLRDVAVLSPLQSRHRSVHLVRPTLGTTREMEPARASDAMGTHTRGSNSAARELEGESGLNHVAQSACLCALVQQELVMVTCAWPSVPACECRGWCLRTPSHRPHVCGCRRWVSVQVAGRTFQSGTAHKRAASC